MVTSEQGLIGDISGASYGPALTSIAHVEATCKIERIYFLSTRIIRSSENMDRLGKSSKIYGPVSSARWQVEVSVDNWKGSSENADNISTFTDLRAGSSYTFMYGRVTRCPGCRTGLPNNVMTPFKTQGHHPPST